MKETCAGFAGVNVRKYVQSVTDGVILTTASTNFPRLFLFSHHFLLTMSANGNGTVHAALAPGHFLFTSESVGEGHPGEISI